MARHEADREDMYAELASCPSRWELQIEGFPDFVLIGIRKDNRLSLFIGPDPVYHYDCNNQLKRAYVDGFLYRTQGTTLARLHRERSATETTLLRHDLDAEELQKFIDKMHSHLQAVINGLEQNLFEILRHQSESDASIDLILKRLRECTNETELAPAYPTRS